MLAITVHLLMRGRLETPTKPNKRGRLETPTKPNKRGRLETPTKPNKVGPENSANKITPLDGIFSDLSKLLNLYSSTGSSFRVNSVTNSTEPGLTIYDLIYQ